MIAHMKCLCPSIFALVILLGASLYADPPTPDHNGACRVSKGTTLRFECTDGCDVDETEGACDVIPTISNDAYIKGEEYDWGFEDSPESTRRMWVRFEDGGVYNVYVSCLQGEVTRCCVFVDTDAGTRVFPAENPVLINPVDIKGAALQHLKACAVNACMESQVPEDKEPENEDDPKNYYNELLVKMVQHVVIKVFGHNFVADFIEHVQT